MIRFGCPRCGAVLKAPEDRAGKKSPCPRCGQRLQVPAPLLTTVLGRPLTPNPATRPVAVPVSASPTPTAADDPLATLLEDDGAAGQPVVRRRARWRRWAAPILLILLALGVGGVSVRLLMTGGYLRPAGQVPEDRPDPRTDEEELVKRFILNNADEGAEVEFQCWGPHMNPAEEKALAKEAGTDKWAESLTVLFAVGKVLKWHGQPMTGEPFRAIVRVRYLASGVPLWYLRELGWPLDKQTGKLMRDELFWVQGKQVIPLGFVPREKRQVSGFDEAFSVLVEAPDKTVGDQWKKNLRRRLAAKYPGIEVERD